MLQDYQWPGNVRELENEAKRLLALTPPGMPLTAEHLSRRIATSPPPEAATAKSRAELERELGELPLRQAGGNRTQTARSLGISRDGLRKKLKRLGLS